MPSTIPVTHLAALSQSLYTGTENTVPAGYVRINSLDSARTDFRNTGMTAATFLSPDGQVVVVFAGTDSRAPNAAAMAHADADIIDRVTSNSTLRAAAGYLAAQARTYARRRLSTRVRRMQPRAVARKTQPKILPTKCKTRDICP
jgi:hypothetical protein